MKDSPIDALILQLRKKGPDNDSYDSSKDAMSMQGQKLIKALKNDDAEKAVAAICNIIDLHETKTLDSDQDDDE
jgi:hypothetical protein